MKASWDLKRDIKTIFDQIYTVFEYATAGNSPYNSAHILMTSYQLVFNTGVFNKDYKTWRCMTEFDQTYVNFLPYFTSAQQELCKTPDNV